ncbi:hypothetical protein H6B32_04300 [Bacteroides gallinaceum]|uniref:GAP1-N1 domain-containing protein n=1 Tax=Bacteroides gallinaceum TaxID=1462571 RepID=UPI00195B4521|nr:hypothetical protein [Bacteroides gallinaceum]MBM6944410.1 hypothetical protein [Bacteroides gallinaceum]
MVIEQTLHGYNMGHGLLASSLPNLVPEDQALLFKMSDWTGFHVLNADEEDSYLTAYPLPSKKYYAIAKTWYADEMERAGCVWTHTLLIPIDDISQEFDFRTISRSFHRPENNNFYNYNSSLEIEDEDMKSSEEIPVFKNFDVISILFLYTFLISKNKGACLKIERSQSELQKLVLSFLQYLPVKYLYDTLLCTGTEAPRKYGNELFSLQFVTGGQAISMDNDTPWEGKVGEENFNEGIRYIINQSLKDEDETPYLIRLFSKDIGSDENKFISVANLLRLLDAAMTQYVNASRPDYKEVLQYIFAAFPNPHEGIIVKNNFYSERIVKLFCAEDEFLYDVATYKGMDKANMALMGFTKRLQNLREDNISDLYSLVNEIASLEESNDATIAILTYAIEQLDQNAINPIIESHWETMFPIISKDKDFILKCYWLEFSNEHFSVFFRSLSSDVADGFTKWNELLDKILSANCVIGDEWASYIVNQADDSVGKILDFANTKDVSPNLLWECRFNERQCLQWIEGQASFGINIIRFISYAIDPSSLVVRLSSPSMWRTFLNSDCDGLDYTYYSFIFQLSFNWHDEYALLFLSHSLDRIYVALSKDQFPQKEWEKIEPFTENRGYIFEWDKCKRLCAGVASYLKKCRFESEVIEKISLRNKVKKQLYKMW